MTNLQAALANTDWRMLRDQKLALIDTLNRLVPGHQTGIRDGLQGLLNFIDAIQDAAESDGFPVVFTYDESIYG